MLLVKRRKANTASALRAIVTYDLFGWTVLKCSFSSIYHWKAVTMNTRHLTSVLVIRWEMADKHGSEELKATVGKRKHFIWEDQIPKKDVFLFTVWRIQRSATVGWVLKAGWWFRLATNPICVLLYMCFKHECVFFDVLKVLIETNFYIQWHIAHNKYSIMQLDYAL